MNCMFRHDRLDLWNIFDVSLIRPYRILQWQVTIRTTHHGMCLIGIYGFGAFPANPLMSLYSCYKAVFSFCLWA